jgi:putative endonuclease
MAEGAFLYILRCSDGSLYIGITRTALEIRVAQHNAGALGGYTATRRPVTLMFSQWFDRVTDAIENERRLKKWSRSKKEAFIRGDFAALKQLSARKSAASVKARMTYLHMVVIDHDLVGERTRLAGENEARLKLPWLKRIVDFHLRFAIHQLGATGRAHAALAGERKIHAGA